MVGILNYKMQLLFVGFICRFLSFVSVNCMPVKLKNCNEKVSEFGGRKAQIYPNL